MNVLIVGAGSIGQRHAKNLLTLGVERVTACDVDAARLEALTSTLRIPGVSRLEEALDRRPEAVLVCTPPPQHLSIARAALDAGAHLFVEKPLAPSLEGTDELVAHAAASGRVAMVACNMRFHPGVATLKDALQAGRLTRPRVFRARFSHALPQWRPGQDYRRSYHAQRDQGGGVLLEGVHELDYLRWLAGEVVMMQASARHVSDLDIDAEDVAHVAVQFASGAVGELTLDFLSPWKLRGCEIIGSDGLLRWSSEGKAPERVVVQHYEGGARAWTDLYRADAYDANEMYLQQMRHFLACVAGTAQPMVDVAQGARVLELALMARRAAASCESIHVEA